MIHEGDKVKLITGEIALIDEVLEPNVAYIAGIFKKGGGVSVDQISYQDIYSVFEEVERPLAHAV